MFRIFTSSLSTKIKMTILHLQRFGSMQNHTPKHCKEPAKGALSHACFPIFQSYITVYATYLAYPSRS